jgi:tetratricopeptide (TPR) repeat protein
MAKCALRSVIFIFFAYFWLISAPTPAFGGGGRDPELLRADELIKRKEYDEAIKVLTGYSRGSQDRFDRAQVLLRRIFTIREEFNRTADELIDTLLNDSDNSEKILVLTRRLFELENENSPLLVSFVSGTRDAAEFNVTRNRLRNILERGREFLDRGDHIAALQTYAGGMDIMRDEFFAAGYGAAIENEVLFETEKINAMLASYRDESAPVGAISAELVNAVNSGNLTLISDLNNRLAPAADSFIRLKRSLVLAVNAIDKIMEEIRADDPEIADRNHLSFLSRLIHGRPGEDIQEGMLGAFDLHWKNSIGRYLDAIALYIERTHTPALAVFGAGDYPSVISSLSGTERYVNLSPPLFAIQLQFHEEKKGQALTLYGDLVLYQDIPSYLKIKALREANALLIQASNVQARQNIDRSSLVNWREGRLSADEAMERELRTRAALIAAQNEIEEIMTKGRQTDTEINLHYQTAYVKNTIDAIEKTRSGFIAEQSLSAQRYYEIAYNDLRNRLTARREELARGRGYLDGQTRVNEAGISVVYRYPSEAQAEFTAALSAMSADLERGNSVLARHRNEPQPISSNADVSGLRNGTQTVVNELNSLRTQGLALAETSRGQTALAETHRQEGERLFREAQTAYQRQNFETARERIQRASERFNSSLEIQESASLRQSWNTQLINLGQTINNAENEMIIAEVRNMVNNAHVSYFAGNFQQAEDSLLRARNRWRITNADENEEIVYWLGIVRGAMSARSNRVIPPTAPLYPEMSQLLSRAQRNYEEGVQMMNSGQRTLGLAKFEEARQLTREVKMMFPVNQEAGILELRMEQFTDPSAFNAAFEQRLNTAIAGTRRRSIESFADLQNLAEINPRYPNIRGILNQAEIDMGYRPPPPNPANIARSRELTASASRILEGNLSTQYEVALEQINEAIRLNPDNADAARVKDRLLNRMSVPGAIVLTREDEEDYQRAMRELQAGNNLVAFALVERLMQNPRNRNITKLIELQRRIQSVIQ